MDLCDALLLGIIGNWLGSGAGPCNIRCLGVTMSPKCGEYIAVMSPDRPRVWLGCW